MSNKDFFKSHEFQFLNLDTSTPLALYFGKFFDGVLKCKIYAKTTPILLVNIKLEKHSIWAELSYANILDCVHSPYEIMRWCPSSFLKHTNYMLWLQHLSQDLDFLFIKNPNLKLPF